MIEVTHMSMLRKKISEEELKKEGWKYVLLFGYTLNVFKKDGKRIFWDSKTETVTHEFSEEEWKKINVRSSSKITQANF